MAVSAHLGGCPQCAAAVDSFRRAAAALAETVEPLIPPDNVRARLARSLDTEVPAPTIKAKPPRSAGAPSGRWLRLLAPVTGVAVVVLLVFTVLLNLRTLGQLEEVQAENGSLRAAIEENSGNSPRAVSIGSVTDGVLEITGDHGPPQEGTWKIWRNHDGERQLLAEMTIDSGGTAIVQMHTMTPVSLAERLQLIYLNGRTPPSPD